MTYTLTATTPALNVPLQDINNSTYGNPQVQSLRMSKESQLEILPWPYQDSDKTIAFDVMGVIRNITINGNNQGTVTQLKKFILDIEGRINGIQVYGTTPKGTSVLTLSMGGAASDIDISYNVVLKSFTWNFNNGAPNQIEWILEMIHGWYPL